jgi:uncharacterized protein (DUF2147 family)
MVPPATELSIRTAAEEAGRCSRSIASYNLFAMHNLLKSVALLLGALVITGAATPGPPPEGDWLTEKKDGIVEISRCGGDTLCGRLVWFRIDANDPNPQALDIKNPDPARRNQPLCGLTLMYGFKPAGPNSWEDGTVYDPEGGKTYHATLKLRDDGAIDLHGYIGFSLFGRSEIWTRDTQPVPSCPTR